MNNQYQVTATIVLYKKQYRRTEEGYLEFFKHKSEGADLSGG